MIEHMNTYPISINDTSNQQYCHVLAYLDVRGTYVDASSNV
jgi:hypothetical protein